MLMANSVEGRFPFLDADVIEFSNLLPAAYKLSGLQEKKVLKDAARGLIPEPIITRQKQPYRTPDAISFLGDTMPEYVEDAFSESTLQAAGMFAPSAAQRLFAKCRQRAGTSVMSNTDNMAFVGMLSAQLLYRDMIAGPRPQAASGMHMTTDVER
jgi:asparagine synthase (glutamine-hydrolysing)